jgi:uncharacterized protein YjbI with pentapeptide repeats
LTMKHLILALALILPLSVEAYDPEHLKKLKETNAYPKCDLRCSLLEGANLSNANLWQAYLEGANLNKANPSEAYLEGAARTLPALDLLHILRLVCKQRKRQQQGQGRDPVVHETPWFIGTASTNKYDQAAC